MSISSESSKWLKQSKILLLIILSVCLLTKPVQAKYSGGTGEPNNPFQIANANDWIDLTNTSADWNKSFCLTSDIDLQGIFLSPVGMYDYRFTGTFDGKGYSIKNAVIDQQFIFYIGLFSYVGKGGLIRDVNVVNVSISGKNYVGGLVGFNDYGTILGCSSTGTVAGEQYIGGLVGYNNFGVVKYCHSVIDINDSRDYTGGLIGYNNSGVVSYSSCSGHISGIGKNVGGLSGYIFDSKITQCFSTVTIKGNNHIGGLAGYVENSILAQCYSTGDITVNGYYNGGLIGFLKSGLVSYSYSSGNISGSGNNTGGIIGYISDGTILQCFSARTISGNYKLGGLAGYIKTGTLMQCYNASNVIGSGNTIGGLVGYNNEGSIIQCYNSGLASGTYDVGGLVGYNSQGTLSSCFWDIETSEILDAIGNVELDSNDVRGLTTAQMLDPNTFLDERWDFVDEIENGTSEIWQMPSKESYPELAVFSGYIPLQLKGEGTSENPYLISDMNELGAINHYDKTAYYRLEKSIDLSDIYWSTAAIPYLDGTFDGNDLAVSNLTIDGYKYLGLFGLLTSDANVFSLGVTDVNIAGTDSETGALAGYNIGNVTNCYSTGTIGENASRIGGLVGENFAEASIICCYSTGNVTGWNSVGGLVGRNNQAYIMQSFSTGNVSGGSQTGGLVGTAFDVGTIIQSYSTGNVSGSSYVGGLLGCNYENSIIQCYSTGAVTGTDSNIGGLVGYYGNKVYQSFWDTQTSGQTTSAGGTGKTTAQMNTQNTFTSAGWDFVDTWQISEGIDYPKLLWE